MRNDQIDPVEDEVSVSVEKKPKVPKKIKGKVGRPKASTPKSKPVMSNFTEEEKNDLTILAESRGQSLSNLVRLAALEQLKK